MTVKYHGHTPLYWNDVPTCRFHVPARSETYAYHGSRGRAQDWRDLAPEPKPWGQGQPPSVSRWELGHFHSSHPVHCACAHGHIRGARRQLVVANPGGRTLGTHAAAHTVLDPTARPHARLRLRAGASIALPAAVPVLRIPRTAHHAPAARARPEAGSRANTNTPYGSGPEVCVLSFLTSPSHPIAQT
jgi:hypothetical protein